MSERVKCVCVCVSETSCRTGIGLLSFLFPFPSVPCQVRRNAGQILVLAEAACSLISFLTWRQLASIQVESIRSVRQNSLSF